MVAKIFTSGNSQALRIPKEYRLDSHEVNIERVGNVYVISATEDPWAALKASLDMFTDDFMVEGRNQPKLMESEASPFDEIPS